jgi:hypothetical protein
VQFSGLNKVLRVHLWPKHIVLVLAFNMIYEVIRDFVRASYCETMAQGTGYGSTGKDHKSCRDKRIKQEKEEMTETESTSERGEIMRNL